MAASRWLLVRMSRGAVSFSMALARWASFSDASRVRAWSSSRPSTRVPRFGPSRTSAGLVPKNCGLLATRVPLTIVQFCEMWWPSYRQPQVLPSAGSPKTMKK